MCLTSKQVNSHRNGEGKQVEMRKRRQSRSKISAVVFFIFIIWLIMNSLWRDMSAKRKTFGRLNHLVE